MILAAGFGSRLKDLTHDLPKPLIPVHEHSLIDYPLFVLKEAGISEVIINTHYHADKIQTALQDGRQYGLKISYSHEETLLGTGGGLKQAEFFFQNEPLVLINCDIICDIDLKQVIEYHHRRNATATMVVREDVSLVNFDEIKLTTDLRIMFINRKPVIAPPYPLINRMFTGIHILDPIVFSYLKTGHSSIITDFYHPAIRNGLPVIGYDYKGFWLDAGSKEALLKARTTPDLPQIRF